MRRLAFSLALVLGCSQATSQTHDVEAGQTMALQPGQSVNIKGTPVVIWLTQVNESPCPSDVQCVAAGDALSIVELSGGDVSRTDTLRLIAEPKTIRYGGYRIGVVSVTPQPVSTKTP